MGKIVVEDRQVNFQIQYDTTHELGFRENVNVRIDKKALNSERNEQVDKLIKDFKEQLEKIK